MKKIKNSRGELTTQQIVLLIILITSFSIILFFFFKLNLGEETQKTICRNSVILKGNSVLSAIRGGNLDCRINYLCISGGGECEGINPTETAEVDISNKEEILGSIANEMADCWWMFGEGKVDYVGLNVEGASIGEKTCALCSIINFDTNIKNTVGKETFGDLYDYLSSTKKDNSQTYLNYLTKKNIYDKTNPVYSEQIDFSEQYVVITGIAKQGALNSISNFALGSVDSFNDVFFGFIDLPSLAEYKDYGPFPVIIVKKDDLNKIECDEFITKA